MNSNWKSTQGLTPNRTTGYALHVLIRVGQFFQSQWVCTEVVNSATAAIGQALRTHLEMRHSSTQCSCRGGGGGGGRRRKRRRRSRRKKKKRRRRRRSRREKKKKKRR